MGWMDNLTRKVSQAEAVTGRRISGPAIESAVTGGLASDYEMAFKNAASERAIRQRQNEINQQTALTREQMAQQNSQFSQSLAQSQDKLNKEYALGLERNSLLGQQGDAYSRAMDKQSVGSMVQMGLTNLPKIEKYAEKAADAISGLFPGAPNPVGTPDPYEAASSISSVGSAFGVGALSGEEAATAAVAGMHGLAGQGASEAITAGFGGSLDFATSASEAVGYWTAAGSTSTAAVVGGLETVVADTIANYAAGVGFSGAMGSIGAEVAAEGVAAVVAETGLMSSLTSGISAVSSFCPYIAPVMLGMSFLAPGVMAPVNKAMGEVVEGITDVAEGAWDVVEDIGSAVGDFFSDIGDSSIICTELYRQGLINRQTLIMTNKYRTEIADPQVYNGYLTIFKPIVMLMKKNRLFNKLMIPLGIGFAKELVHRVRPCRKGSLIGTILVDGLSPICKLITVVKEKKENIHERFGHSRWSSTRV